MMVALIRDLGLLTITLWSPKGIPPLLRIASRRDCPGRSMCSKSESTQECATPSTSAPPRVEQMCCRAVFALSILP